MDEFVANRFHTAVVSLSVIGWEDTPYESPVFVYCIGSTVFEQSMLPMRHVFLPVLVLFYEEGMIRVSVCLVCITFCKRRQFKLTPFHFNYTQS